MSSRSREDAQDRIEGEASAWVVRIGEGNLSPEQERQFAAWRDAAPENDSRFQALQRIWGEIPTLTGLASLAPQREIVAPAARSAVMLKRYWILGGLAAAAATAAVVLIPAGQPVSGRGYATRLAQSRRIALPDGSVVTLGARSAISVQFTADERRIVLNRGEAFFEVVHNAGRPFLVQAGSSLVRDIGTKFDVKLGAGTMHVAVQEGLIQVGDKAQAADSGTGTAMLRAGQRAEIAQGASADPARIVALPSPTAGAWRAGRLVYDNSRLADLVADVNRYYAPGVRLTSASAGELRITASFRTNEIPAFMNALNSTLPVKAQAQANGGFEISTPHS